MYGSDLSHLGSHAYPPLIVEVGASPVDIAIVAAHRIGLAHIVVVAAHSVGGNTVAPRIGSLEAARWADSLVDKDRRVVDRAANSGLDRSAAAPVTAMVDSRDRVDWFAGTLAIAAPDSSC